MTFSQELHERVTAELKDVLRMLLGTDPSQVRLDANIFDDLNADSLDAIEIVMHCEERFGLEMTETELEGVYTVGDLVALIEKTLPHEGEANAVKESRASAG